MSVRTRTEARNDAREAARREVAPAATPDTIERRLPSRYRERDFRVRRMLAYADSIAILVAVLASLPFGTDTPVGRYVLWGAITVPAWVVLMKLYGLYDRDAKRVSHGTIDDLPWVFHAVVIGMLLMWLHYRFLAGIHLPLAQSVALAVIAMAAVLVLRAAFRTAATRRLPGERVALVAGAGRPLRRPASGEVTLLVGAERQGLPDEVVAACDRGGVAMVFAARRHFRH
jgi:FlaA1/EpsC-like NDP-sugar epimerase